MKHYALIYDVADDYLERRGEFRATHLDLARLYAENGELVLGGAFADPADSALLVFKVADRSRVEAFVEADPYVANGLVDRWVIREWTTVVGEGAIAPVA